MTRGRYWYHALNSQRRGRDPSTPDKRPPVGFNKIAALLYAVWGGHTTRLDQAILFAHPEIPRTGHAVAECSPTQVVITMESEEPDTTQSLSTNQLKRNRL